MWKTEWDWDLVLFISKKYNRTCCGWKHIHYILTWAMIIEAELSYNIELVCATLIKKTHSNVCCDMMLYDIVAYATQVSGLFMKSIF